MASLLPIPKAGQQVPRAALEGVSGCLLRRAGLRERDAAGMASVLVFAQASGIESHGLMHLPHYIGGIARGMVRARPQHRILQHRPGVAVLDADDGPGILSALAATDLAIRLARTAGLGSVAVRNSGHFGVASAYVARMLSQGMAGLVLSNASPSVAPRGGVSAALGTNPIAAGFPRADGPPVIIDLSTTAGSRARVRLAQAAGEAIPAGWALDEDGKATTDPTAALEGTMQAMGGAKGTSLSLMVELFCVALSGGLPGAAVRPPQDTEAERCGVSHLFLAFDAEAFVGSDAMARKVEDIAGGIETSPAADPEAPLRLPGARAAAARKRAQSEGIFVSSQLETALRRAEREANKVAETASPSQARG